MRCEMVNCRHQPTAATPHRSRPARYEQVRARQARSSHNQFCDVVLAGRVAGRRFAFGQVPTANSATLCLLGGLSVADLRRTVGLARLLCFGAARQHGSPFEFARRFGGVAGLAHFGRVASQALEYQVGVVEFAFNLVEPGPLGSRGEVKA